MARRSTTGFSRRRIAAAEPRLAGQTRRRAAALNQFPRLLRRRLIRVQARTAAHCLAEALAEMAEARIPHPAAVTARPPELHRQTNAMEIERSGRRVLEVAACLRWVEDYDGGAFQDFGVFVLLRIFR